jgi:hypothetical protein
MPPTGYVEGLARYFLKLVTGLATFTFILMLINALLMKEIRLYRDRLVQVCRLLGEKEVQLATANFRGGNVPPYGMKYMYPQDWNRFSGLIRGILYDEYLAEREDVKKLNACLADLSGREIEEFEGLATKMTPFIKGESMPATTPNISSWFEVRLGSVLRILRNTDRPMASYVWRAWLIAVIPSLVISMIVTVGFGLPGPSMLVGQRLSAAGPTLWDLGTSLLDLQPAGASAELIAAPPMRWIWGMLFLSPWVETLLMWPIIRIIKEVTRNSFRIAIASALIWGCIHSSVAIAWGLAVFWPFFVFSVCFLEWEKKSEGKAIVATALVHACQNMLPAVLALMIWIFSGK